MKNQKPGKLLNGANVFLKAFQDGFKPKEILTVSQWADKYRKLSTKTSSEPGQYRTDRTPYCKEIADELSHMSTAKKVVWIKSAQVGAALALDTEIPTPNGWTTMGDVKEGDFVYDEKGHTCKVVFKSEIFKDHKCYKIKFSDKSEVICDASHKWTVRDQRKDKNSKLITLTADEMAKSFKFQNNRNTYSIKNTNPIFCRKKNLPIDPYLLGVWLGDGNRYTGILYLNRLDSLEILEKINRKVRVRSDSDNCNECLVDGLHSQLRIFELLKKDKKIPGNYLRASYRQRLELLKGLMDTDGSISDNRCEYSTVDEGLKNTVYELLVSLGIKASIYEVVSKNGVSGPRISPPRPLWRISFTVFGINVFSLKRKTERHRVMGRISETEKRMIVDISEVKTVNTQCIGVNSPSHLYLCSRSFIPTHNTELGLNWLGYIIDQDPATTMVVWPTIPDVKKNSKLRISPLIDSTPRLKDKVSDGKGRDASNNTTYKDFDGGALVLAGAVSPAGLCSTPAKNLFLDEIDRFPDDCGGEGDPIALVMARSRTFSKRKAFLCSTPTIKGRSKIEKEFKASDQRYYQLACPHCTKRQKLIFKQLHYSTEKDENGEKVVINAAYFCEHCGEEIQEHHKTKMLGGGKWVKENPKSEVPGFHINALYSPLGWYSWKEIAQDWVDAQGDSTRIQAFVNTVLGETYELRGEKPEEDLLFSRRELYKIGSVPRGAVFLTLSIDVQDDRLEGLIQGWGRGREVWDIEHVIIPGAPTDAATWEDLEVYMTSTFKHVDGYEVGIKMVGIDSGYQASQVYAFCEKYDSRRVIPIKGQKTLDTMVSTPKPVQTKDTGKRIRRGVKLWRVATDMIKTELYGDLQKLPPDDLLEGYPKGFIHFPLFEREYFLQLTAEERTVTKDSKGFNVVSWVKIRERNEILDLHVYGRALAHIIGIDRLNESGWQKLESQIRLAPKLQSKENSNQDRSGKKKRKKKVSDYW